MARFTPLPANKFIKDTYAKINNGFDNFETDVNAHFAGSADNHNASDVVNDSAMTGTKVSDALTGLKTQIDEAVVGGSANSLIGVFTITDTGSANAYAGVFAGQALFTDMKIYLTNISADNTGASTMSYDGGAAKSIVKIVKNVKTELSPRDIRQGEIAILQYDGTDFILLNGEREAEYSTEEKSFADIISLPTTAVGGELALEVSGQTATNLLGSDGRFDTVAGWIDNQNSSIVASDDRSIVGEFSAKVTASGGGSAVKFRYKDYAVNEGEYLVVAGAVASTSSSLSIAFGLGISFDSDGHTDSRTQILTGLGDVTQWNLGAKKIQVPSSSTIIRVRLNGTGDGVISYYDAIRIYKISESEYNKTETEVELLAKYPYIDNTKSVDKMRILNVGKNLLPSFDLWDFTDRGGMYISPSEVLTSDTIGSIFSPFFKIKPNVNHRVSAITPDGTVRYRVRFYDRNKQELFDSGNITTFPATYLSPINSVYATFQINPASGSTNRLLQNLQIEEGSTVTPYEPYSANQSVNPKQLRNLPNGVKDTFNANTGVHRQNVSAPVDIATTDYDTATDLTEVTIIKTTAFTPALAGTSAIDGRTRVYNKDGAELQEIAEADADDATLIGLAYYYDSDKKINFVHTFEEAIADARTALGTSKVQYQLASPVTEYFFPSVLNAKASGTIYQESFVEEVQAYSSGLPLTDTNYPIANLVEMFKIDQQTGALTPIALSSVTPAVDGTSITSITGAVDGEWYYFSYNYPDELRVNGSMGYGYGVNLKSQTDSLSKQAENLDRENKQLQTLLQTAISRISAIEDELAAP